MPTSEDRIGLLVIRAFVEDDRRHRLLVEILEVNPPPSLDRIIGIAGSASAASLLIREWLDALQTDAMGAGDASRQ